MFGRIRFKLTVCSYPRVRAGITYVCTIMTIVYSIGIAGPYMSCWVHTRICACWKYAWGDSRSGMNRREGKGLSRDRARVGGALYENTPNKHHSVLHILRFHIHSCSIFRITVFIFLHLNFFFLLLTPILCSKYHFPVGFQRIYGRRHIRMPWCMHKVTLFALLDIFFPSFGVRGIDFCYMLKMSIATIAWHRVTETFSTADGSSGIRHCEKKNACAIFFYKYVYWCVCVQVRAFNSRGRND